MNPPAISPPAPVRELPRSAEQDLACEIAFRFLAATFSSPRSDAVQLLLDARSCQLVAAAGDLLRADFSEEPIPLGFGEAPAEDLDFRPLIHAIRPNEMDEEYVRIFSHATCRECPPYETEYLPGDEPFSRAQHMADIAGFYQAFGVSPGTHLRERVDHVSLELEFMALLLLKQRSAATTAEGEVCEGARRNFFRDHLAWWAPSFAVGVRRKAETGCFAAAGKILAALLPIERRRLGVAPPRMPLEPQVEERTDSCEGCLLASPS